MAQPIQDPTVGGALQALFSLQGRVRPALEEFIVPTVRIADLSQGATPAISRHASAAFNQAAVAGEHAQLRFEMIPGALAVIRRLHLVADTDTMIRINFPGNAATLGALGTVAAKGFTDGRVLAGSPGGEQNPAAVLTYGTAVAPLGAFQVFFQALATEEVNIEPRGWVVGTGRPDLYGFLELDTYSLNVQLRGSIEWDEYQL